VRCVSTGDWVTAAETAECVLALDALGMDATRSISSSPGRTCASPTAPTGRGWSTPRRSRSPRTSARPTPSPPWCWRPTPSRAPRRRTGLFRGECLPAALDLAEPHCAGPAAMRPGCHRRPRRRSAGAGHPSQDPQAAAGAVLGELSRVERGASRARRAAGRRRPGRGRRRGWPANRPGDVGRPAPEVGPGRLLAVAAVDEAEGQRVRQRAATVGESPTTPTTGPRGRRLTAVPPVGRVSMRPDVGVDQVGLVMLPTGLVLLRAAVVVDAEQHGTGRLGGRPEVDGGLAAPGADLDEGSGCSFRNCTTVPANSASPQSAGIASAIRAWAFLGKRSSIASQLSLTRPHTACPATRLASNPVMTIHPFWLRTSVIARLNVRIARSMSGKADSAWRERISSCGVGAAR
jgi:hypothetical protein